MHWTSAVSQILLVLLIWRNIIFIFKCCFLCLSYRGSSLVAWEGEDVPCLFNWPFIWCLCRTEDTKLVEQILVSICILKRFCTNLAKVCLLHQKQEWPCWQEKVCVFGQGLREGEREGGLEEGTSAVLQLQRWSCTSTIRRCLWTASACCDLRCLLWLKEDQETEGGLH